MKITRDLTSKQTAILKFIHSKIADEGRPPTIREIGQRFGFRSTGTTRDHLTSLSKKGYIKLSPKQARSIELVKPVAFRIPILGSIMAGMPDLALEEIEDYVYLDDLLPNQDRQIFGLKIKGDSMKDKGIHEGDIAIVKRQRLANVGEIIAALLGNEATIKILKKKDSEFYLAPANSAYPEIRKPFTIIGRVIALLKKF
jgi:repressor LexA